jgi:adenylate cyclase
MLTEAGWTLERSVALSWLFKVRGPIPAPAEVAVVAIDSNTGNRLGLSSLPREWPRSVHGRLVDELVRRGASVIVFDMQFDKPRGAQEDAEFARAVDAADRVALIELVTGRRQPVVDANGVQSGSVWVEGLVQPLPALVQAAKGLGTFPLPKIDATVHEFWAFKESVGDAPTIPAVALQIHALTAYSSWRALLERVEPAAAQDLPRDAKAIGKAGGMRELMARQRALLQSNPGLAARVAAAIEQDGAGSDNDRRLLRALRGLYAGAPHRLLNFYGPPGTIQTVAFAELLKQPDAAAPAAQVDLRGKAVFVGFSDLYDPGQPDRFYTVFTNNDGVDLSGVEIAATAFGNLLTDLSIQPVDASVDLGLILAFGLIVGTGAYFFRPAVGIALAVALALAYAASAQWLFNLHAQWLPIATPLALQFPAALFLGLLGQYLLERRRGQQMNKALSYYVPEDVARALGEPRVDAHAFNRVVYGTCLATDMSGFSTIAEQLPPDQLAVFLNDYFDTLAQPLKRHGVSVTEFRADAIMCAWTGQASSLAMREQPVTAALEAGAAIAAFKQRQSLHRASLRIGLACGSFYLGHAGGGGRFVFSIVGDTANTASRIESLNKHVGTSVLATQGVVEGLQGLLLRPLGAFQFMGKSEALPIVEIMAASADATQEQIRIAERFAEALDLFHLGKWDAAAERFEALLEAFPEDGPARFYLARCRAYLGGAAAPEDARVIRMDSK